MLFEGLSAFPITPANEKGRVDVEALSRLTARLVDARVDSIGLLGSTGTYAYLTRDERRRAVEAAMEVAGSRVPVMVSAGALRTDDAALLARDAAEAGADAVFVAPMSYTPLTDDEVLEHYRTVAAATDKPLCVYNNPGTTHFSFSIDLLGRLARIPTIAAVKMPLPADSDIGAELAQLRSGPTTGLKVGYSGDWGIADALLSGADCFYSGLAGILPREVLALARAAQDGNAEKVSSIDSAFMPVWALFKQFGGLRVIYAIANEVGLRGASPPLPVQPLVGDDLANVAEVLATLPDVLF